MIIDAHLHCTGRETRAQVLQTLDEAGIDVGVLLAPFLSDGYSLNDAASLRRANEHLAQLVRGAEDRLVGLAVVNPQHADAPRDLRRAIESGLRGAKMVPSGWYPYDEAVQPTFAEASRLRLPLLFHSGIFIDGRSGRFCRPTFFEALRDHPGARVALAHLSWPWTDEAIAVGLIDRIHGVPDAQAAFRFDLSFGPPPPYRLEVLRRALEVLGPGLLQYGSDCFLPCPGTEIAERRGWLQALLDELGTDAATQRQIYSGTAAAWLGLDTDRIDGHSRRREPATPVAAATTSASTAAAGTPPDLAEPVVAPEKAAAPSRAGPAVEPEPRCSLWSQGWSRRWSPVCC